MKDLIDDAKSHFVDEEEQMEHPMKVITVENKFFTLSFDHDQVFNTFPQDDEDEESRIFIDGASDPKAI